MTKGKKNVKFREVTEEEKEEIRKTDVSKSRRFKEKHSLDSDEELDDDERENGDEKNVLDEDDIEGQEDETIRNDEGITVTPFNLKDELEEGHFDGQGNYIANKDTDATDEWLESVDWKKVEDQKTYHQKSIVKKIEEEEPILAPVKVMQDMLEIMKPGENVLKCLRRLGGNKKQVSSADRWKKKKMKLEEEPVDEEVVKNKLNLLKLTGLADDLLQGGDFQIYEKPYEQIKYEVKSKISQFEDADEDDELEAAFKKPRLDGEEKSEKQGRKVNDDVDHDDNELEATFNESYSKKDSKDSKDILEPQCSKVKTVTTATKDEGVYMSEVRWIYKLENNDVSGHLGPYTSTQMLKMQEDGKFADGVYCRKVGSEGSFYNSNRIDFDLYT